MVFVITISPPDSACFLDDLVAISSVTCQSLEFCKRLFFRQNLFLLHPSDNIDCRGEWKLEQLWTLLLSEAPSSGFGRDSRTHCGEDFINFAGLAKFWSPSTCCCANAIRISCQPVLVLLGGRAAFAFRQQGHPLFRRVPSEDEQRRTGEAAPVIPWWRPT